MQSFFKINIWLSLKITYICIKDLISNVGIHRLMPHDEWKPTLFIEMQ